MLSSWVPPKMWEDGECYIIGGGPSVPRLFGVPRNLIQDVLYKKAPISSFSEYLEPIHHKHIIGINNAYELGNWVNVVFFGDKSWYLKNRMKLAQLPILKVSCSNYFASRAKAGSYEGIKFVLKDAKVKFGLSKDPQKIAWNYHSGAAAIDLAIHFGVKRIYLLGFDMCCDSKNISHWHTEHKTVKEMVKNPAVYVLKLRPYPVIAKQAKELGVEIFNTNPDSAIDAFPVREKPWQT